MLGAAIAAAMMIVTLAPVAFAAAEDSFLSKLNAERTSRGLAPLQSNWDLVDDAELQSQAMMDADNLYHNPNLAGVTTGWVLLGENVGVGPSVSSIHAAFMASPSHTANILGDYTDVGIGAVRESDDKLWVTVVFMKAEAPSPSPTTTAGPPAPTTTPAPSITQPPATQPPATQPPATQPPATHPPETRPPEPNPVGGSAQQPIPPAGVATRLTAAVEVAAVVVGVFLFMPLSEIPQGCPSIFPTPCWAGSIVVSSLGLSAEVVGWLSTASQPAATAVQVSS